MSFVSGLKCGHVFVVTVVLTLLLVMFGLNVRQMSSAVSYVSLDFQVFGRVQGVFFRKFTKRKADELGVYGYCMNARDGTVVGTIQASHQLIQQMKDWLQNTGSPYSRIERCEFTNERIISELEYNKFEVRH